MQASELPRGLRRVRVVLYCALFICDLVVVFLWYGLCCYVVENVKTVTILAPEEACTCRLAASTEV